jgi:4'-phosphopantetheinyl transferase EntD
MNDILEESGFKWGLRKIEGTSEELFDLLNKKEIYFPFIHQVKQENRKREWLSVRLLLKELLGGETEILYTESGKPYLIDHPYRISISHSKDYVAIALDRNGFPGIDIEYLSSRINKVKDRFISDSEEQNLSHNNKEVHLLLHWSAKESMFKALDEQNVEFKTCLHINPFEPVMSTLSSFTSYETRTENRYSFLINYIVESGYVLTFTSLKRNDIV